MENFGKSFAKLMMEGKLNAAMKLLDEQESVGVLDLNDNTMDTLRNLHPVIFTNIDEESIAKAATKTKGAAGPSGMDADGWRCILISKNYGTAGKDLRTAIAKMSQLLCTREVQMINSSHTSIEAYTACRLIPLEKKPTGVRPIGIGEVLHRIIGKAVIAEIKPDLIESAGCLQLCAGQKLGCEAAAHAICEIFQEEKLMQFYL